MSHFQSLLVRVSVCGAPCGVPSIEVLWPGECLTYYIYRVEVDSLPIVHVSIWYGVQASIGGSCMLVMLRAMWPSVNNIRMSLAI